MRLRAACHLAVPVALGLLVAGPADAVGDRALGEYLFGECSACHQVTGRQAGGIPAVTGLPEDRFVAAMEAYRTRDRDSQVMHTIAARLTAEEVAALASYLGSLGRGP